MTKTRKSLLGLLVTMLIGVFAFAVACSQGKESKGPKFLEGAYTEVTLGESVLIDEFVDFGDEKDYRFTITDPDNKEKNLSNRPMWTPETLGVHKMTYTINSGVNAGTATYDVTVVPYDLEWSYNNFQSITLQMGEPIIFDELLYGIMNARVTKSSTDADIKMISVTVDGVKTEFSETQTSYTPQSLSDHVFRFRVTSEDGQSDEATVIVSIQYIDEVMSAWSTENEVTYHKYLQVMQTNGQKGVRFNAGEFTGKTNSIGSTSLPYMAYNGEYGAGDYVMFDFTGSNLPQLCFFADEPSPDITNGGKGIYLNNYINSGNKSYAKRQTIFGPYKVQNSDMLTDSDRLDVSVESALSANNLKANKKYRYIAGFSNVTGTVFDTDNTTVITAGTATLHQILFDLEYGTIVFDEKVTLNPMNLKQEAQQMAFPADYFTGSIVAYGTFEKKTAFDNVYPVFEDVADPYTLVTQASFAKNYTSVVATGATLNVSDYITPEQNAEYDFYYVNADGERTDIKTSTFTFAQNGEYRLCYAPKTDGVMPCSEVITVLNMADTAKTWLANNNVKAYGVSEFTESQGVTLKAGSYTGRNNASLGVMDVPYVAFTTADGTGFGLGDTLAFEFTGNNLPYMSFFDEEITNATKNLIGGKGFVFSGGVLSKNKGEALLDSQSDNFRLFAPTKFGNSAWEGAFYAWTTNNNADYNITIPKNDGGTKPVQVISNAGLGSDEYKNRNYRCLVSFTDVTAGTTSSTPTKPLWKIGITLLLIDLSDNTTLFNVSMKRNYVPDTYGGAFANESDFNGNMILYGRPYQETKLNKIYPIFENKSTAKVQQELSATV